MTSPNGVLGPIDQGPRPRTYVQTLTIARLARRRVPVTDEQLRAMISGYQTNVIVALVSGGFVEMTGRGWELTTAGWDVARELLGDDTRAA